MSFLRIIGPASIEVWISSPVRSRKPVLMNTMRSAAARMQALRLTVVRRSSSMMPILRCVAGKPEHVLDGAEQLVGEGDLVGPVHLGLDDVDRAGAACCERALPLRSWIAISEVTAASRMLSGISGRLVEHRVGEHVVADIAHQHEAAPVQAQLAAVRGRVDAVGLRRRSTVRPPFSKLSASVPFIRPSQLR